MNVSLTPELERYINEKVEGGSYRSASEVVRESVRLMQRVEEDRAARLAALRRDIDEAVAQMDRGEGIDGEEVFAEILRSLERDEDL
ncbi:MAG TPA: type II toxin-antitoxin system ParD family antitoxin [Longimicrobiaceae bacterium]|jgi:antitoxin ParD1/3/4|nr:type II toxin-antitoxin system ParD family antitoxin [Longimicrobiaceae bacterium]